MSKFSLKTGRRETTVPREVIRRIVRETYALKQSRTPDKLSSLAEPGYHLKPAEKKSAKKK